jgi:hypothetical protein
VVVRWLRSSIKRSREAAWGKLGICWGSRCARGVRSGWGSSKLRSASTHTHAGGLSGPAPLARCPTAMPASSLLPKQLRACLSPPLSWPRSSRLTAMTPSGPRHGQHSPPCWLPSWARAVRALSEATQHARAARCDAWQRWVDLASVDGAGRLYRWIRGGASSASLIRLRQRLSLAMVSQTLTRSPLQAASGGRPRYAAASLHSCAISRSIEVPSGRVAQTQAATGWLEGLAGLPACSKRVLWTAALVRAVMRRMALGVDGCAVGELRRALQMDRGALRSRGAAWPLARRALQSWWGGLLLA